MLSPRFVVLFLCIIASSLVFPTLGQSPPGFYLEHKLSFTRGTRRVVAVSLLPGQVYAKLDERIGYVGRLWNYNPTTGGIYSTAQTDQCLQVEIPANRASGAPLNNDKIVLATCNGASIQKWNIPTNGDWGDVQLQDYPSFCFAASNGISDIGTAIRLWTCDAGVDNRRFKWDYTSLDSTTSANSESTSNVNTATTNAANSASTSAQSVSTSQSVITTSVNSVSTSVNSFTTSVNSITTSFDSAATSRNSAATTSQNSATTSADNSASTAAVDATTTSTFNSATTSTFNSATTSADNSASTGAVNAVTTTGFHTTTTGAYAATTGFSDYPFFIRHKASADIQANRVLAVLSPANDARITLQIDYPRTARLWRFNSVTNQIVSLDYPTLCLSVRLLGAAPANNDPVVVHTCNTNSPYQKWAPESFTAYGKLKLAAYTNMCVAAFSGDTSIGNTLNLWQCDKQTTTANRMYKFDVPNTYP